MMDLGEVAFSPNVTDLLLDALTVGIVPLTDGLFTSRADSAAFVETAGIVASKLCNTGLELNALTGTPDTLIPEVEAKFCVFSFDPEKGPLDAMMTGAVDKLVARL